MDNNLNYETYIYLSSKKLIISVYTDLDKEIYQEKLEFKNKFEESNFEKLDYFLNINIFKIEKKIKTFVQNVSIILDLDILFPVEISVKKNNYGDKINSKILHHLLQEAKDSCKVTLNEKKIVHMLITDYLVDNKSYLILPRDINCSSFSLNLKFICISNIFVKDLEVILKKYQISLNKLFSASYLREYSSNQEEIFAIAKKIIKGHNPNEVTFVDKMRKNKGFFERFFNLFS